MGQGERLASVDRVSEGVETKFEGKPLLQVWEGEVGGITHRVELYGPTARRILWLVDGQDAGHKTTTAEKAKLEHPAYGRLVVRMSLFGAPRRATVFPADSEGASSGVTGLAGIGGTDLHPEAGSKAEAYGERMLAHPRLYTARETLGAAGGVLLPILITLLVGRIALAIPWPSFDLPAIPWPSIPWPSIDLPSIPWPEVDLPDIAVPGWVTFLAETAKYVVPVIVAFFVARAEIRRRRTQHEHRPSVPDAETRTSPTVDASRTGDAEDTEAATTEATTGVEDDSRSR